MMPVMFRALCIFGILFACAAAPADAQRRSAQDQSGRRIEIAPQQVQPGRNEQAEIERTLPYLAFTLGELHYLAFACEGSEVQTWRDRMVELLALEAPGDGRRRSELISAFNDGYAAQQRYRTRCGFEAEAERSALAHRGRDLAEAIRDAYFD